MTFQTFKAGALGAAAALALLACAAPAGAATLTTLAGFDDIAAGASYGAGDTFVSGGLLFRLEHCCARIERFFDNPADDNGTNQLMFTDDQPYEGFGGALLHITRAGGGRFDLTHGNMHLGDNTDPSPEATDYMEILGYRDGAFVDGAGVPLAHDPAAFFYIPGMVDLDEVVITPMYYQHSGWLALDNFAFLDSGGGSTAPEPAAWALMILGFGGAGGILRRRRTALA